MHHITQRGNNRQDVFFTDDAWTSGGGQNTDQIIQHVWGLRYIDDLVLTRQDYDLNGDYANNRNDYTHYALSDHQFSVVAMIDDAGKLLERVDYTPSGVARHQFYNDIDGDGDVDANDNSLASSASGSTIGQSNYNVDADFDRDGDVDSNDTVLAGSTYYKSALPAGWISSPGNGGNAFGYCGYRFNQETALYLVRFRNFDPANGRWLERDPAGYMDSMSLYGYGFGNPIIGMDPFGLAKSPKEVMGAFNAATMNMTPREAVLYGIRHGIPIEWIAEVLQLPVKQVLILAGGIATGVLATEAAREAGDTIIPIMKSDDPDEQEHRTNRRESNRQKHEDGRARKKMDRGREKGDDNRPYRKGGKRNGPRNPGIFESPLHGYDSDDADDQSCDDGESRRDPMISGPFGHLPAFALP